MKGNHFNLDELKRTNFVNAPRTHVIKAYEILLGQGTAEGVELEALREELQRMNQLEQIHQMQPPEPKPEAQGIGRIPNLSPSGEWEGRKRRVTVHNQHPDSLSGAFTIGWEGMTWTVAYDKPVDMPWPYWEALKNAKRIDRDSTKAVKWEKDEATGQLQKVVTPIITQVYSFSDHGDVPGTEKKPESYLHFFQEAARRTAVFKDSPAPVLLLIYQRLFDGLPTDRNHNPVQLDRVSLRVRLAERLGTEFVNLINEEIYSAA